MSAAGQVRLVARREITTRVRDKGFIISSLVIVLLVVGVMIFQLVAGGRTSTTSIGVVGGNPSVETALQQAGEASGTAVTVTELPDEAAARQAVADGDVDGAVLDPTGDSPQLLVESSGSVDDVVRSAVGALSVGAQLAAQGVDLQPAPTVSVTELDPSDDDTGPAVVVALVGVVVLYGLLILFGQFVAQGVVEEKSSRVVELLLSTMKPWQLLAGKILGLGVLGLAQMVLIAVVGVTGALALGVVSVPGQLIGTVLVVIGWFLVGYAFYASVFAAAASLVSRQEDLGSVLTPTTLLLVVGFFISIQAGQDPGSGLATVTSFVPGLTPLVMPVRMAAGDVPLWQVLLAVAIMAAAIALVVRVGGRVYAGALLRTGGKTKLREALRAERA